MFQVKVCGVTSAEDAGLVAAARPDAIGLNFCSTSPRLISLEVARQIDQVLPGEIARVAVVVNAGLEEIDEIRQAVRLDYLQLHGDEPPSFVAEVSARFPGLPVIRAFRCRRREGEEMLSGIVQYVDDCLKLAASPAGLLVDAYDPNHYGGTGKTLDWDHLAELPPELRSYPLILAGGLRPDNVAEAIRRSRVAAVDTASGVEREVGRKDAELVRSFVESARRALPPPP